jgi:UDP-4-amino-4,6-dideoxy-N-acetyl-beta-L-altrosamine transaminase
MKKFPYSCQNIDRDDIDSVVDVLKSDFLTQGPKVQEFEEALAKYCGAEFAVAFSSGTAALHSAYFTAGIGGGDEIITSPITFMATSNAALFLSATPKFSDVEKDTGNLDTDVLEKAITDNTEAIVPVHFAGHPVDMEKIYNIAQKHNLTVIEDACHALSARYKSEIVGNCRYSDMSVFSFHAVKPITTAEGGAVVTNDKGYYKKLKIFRHHGVTKDRDLFRNDKMMQGGWYHEMYYLGFNYRITDIQAALGCSQLRKMDDFAQKRKEIVSIYTRNFAGNPYFDIPKEKSYAESSWHLYPIRLNDKYKVVKDKIFTQLRQKGLLVQVHYIPVYLQPYYKKLGYKPGLCPSAEDFYEREISIPLFPAMTDSDVEYVAKTLTKVLEQF